MKQLHLLSIAAALLIVRPATSQTALFSWAGTYEGGNNATEEVTDMFWKSPGVGGDILNTGYFSGTVDFDMGTGNATLISNGMKDIFVSRQSDNGNYIWAVSIGGAGDDVAWSIADSPDENLIIAGSFSGTVDFDPGIGTSFLTSAGGKDGFILKLDRLTGTFMWAVNAASGIGNESINALAFLSDSSIVAAGNFELVTDFDPSTGTFTQTSIGLTDVFVSVLSFNGTYINSASVGGSNRDSVFCAGVDANNFIFINGSFESQMDADPSGATQILNGIHTQDMFVVKLSSSLIYDNCSMFATPSHVEMLCDASSYRVVFAGSFSDSLDFNLGAAQVYTHAATPGNYDVFVADYGSSLTSPINIRLFGGSNDEHVSAINNYYNYLAIGGYTNSYSFDCTVNPQDTTILSCTGNDIFALTFDYFNGILFNSSTLPNNNLTRTLLAIDTYYDAAGYSLLLGGGFTGTQDFDPTSSNYNLSATGNSGSNCWLSKWNPCATYYVGTSFAVCDSVYLYNNVSYPVPGIINDTLTCVCGADSIITITLQPSVLDTGITVSGFTLSSQQSFAIYQWVDCNANYTAIPGATSQSFSPTVDGTYALIVNNSVCAEDTSACISIIGIGIDEMESISLHVSPNPFTSTVFVNGTFANSTIEISDISGKIVYITSTNGTSATLDLDTLAPGTYFLKATSGQNIIVKKLIKE